MLLKVLFYLFNWHVVGMVLNQDGGKRVNYFINPSILGY